MRADRPLCLTVKGRNIVTDCFITSDDIKDSVAMLCKNSFYSYFDCIKNGYIPFDDGYRIGVCGHAVTEGDVITNITEISSLNVRIPTSSAAIPEELLKSLRYDRGILIYSKANAGKTTLLKFIASYLASPPLNKRVIVLDPKKELFSKELHGKLPIDFFIGYPKYKAMDIALKNMSPEVLICDEIGIEDDTAPFVECKNCGVSIICSAHASSIDELLARERIKLLAERNVFDDFVGIALESGARKYRYTKREEIVI